MLDRLVAFDTTSRDGNLPLIEFVEDYLDGWGIPHLRVDYEAGKKTNLYATIGPDIAGGIVLSGHTDVVPVDGQAWTSDPFALTETRWPALWPRHLRHEGLSSPWLSPWCRSSKRGRLKTPIHLALSCDEEVGCKGVRPLVAHIRDHLPKPARRHRRRADLDAGRQRPQGRRHLRNRSHRPRGAFELHPSGRQRHHGGGRAPRRDQPHPPTMSRSAAIRRAASIRPIRPCMSGLIEGGTAKNIIPRRCAFQWETRLLPGADPREVPDRFEAFARRLEPAMKAVAPGAGIENRQTNVVPGLAPETEFPAEHLALHLAAANGTHAVSYGTEAGLFQEIGIPAVICGPGSIEQAHKPDEYVEIAATAEM